MILSACNDPGILKSIMVIRNIINIVMIVVPALVIISIIYELSKAIMNNNMDLVKEKLTGNIIKIIVCLFIFFIPTLTNAFVGMLPNTAEYKECLLKANPEGIQMAWEYEAQRSLEVVKRTNKEEDLIVAKEIASHVVNDVVRKKINKQLDYINNNLKERRKAENAVAAAERTLFEKDIKKAQEELKKVKSEQVKKEYEQRISQAEKKEEEIAVYNGKTFEKGDWTYKGKGNTALPYAIYVPKGATGPLPVFVWLHGSGEAGSSADALLNSGMPKAVTNWNKSGLKNIPAIIVAPHLQGYKDWKSEKVADSVESIINEVKSKHSVNDKKVSLIGHSLGGSGAQEMAPKMPNTFNAVVVLSGYNNKPKDSEYFSNIPMKGYSDGRNQTQMTSFFGSLGRSNDLVNLNVSHGKVPETALYEDANGDGMSDLVAWMLAQ